MPKTALKTISISPARERSRIIRSVILGTLLLVLILAAALATQAATGRSRKAVIEAMNLERALHSLLSSIQDAETGQRGYLITGDGRYLEPYLASLESTPEALSQLSKFIGKGEDQTRFNLLTMLIRRRYEELTATIGMKRTGDTAGAMARVNLDDGKELMDSIRQEIKVLKKSEQAKVNANIAVVQSLFNLDLVLQIIIFAGMFVILYFLYSRLRPLISQLESTLKEKESEITIRSETEDANNSLIADLKNKNEDLDHFAYIASHDLQEPLRTVTNFIGVIEEEYGETIGEEGKPYFDFINIATDRMRVMIETLLRYSQLGRGSELQTVDLNKVVSDVKQLLNAKIRETGAEIKVSELPVLTAYPVEITQVFQNLINNALKFVKQGVAPRIEIFQAPEGTSFFRIGVKDNGIGMNEAAVGKIFQMFSRVNEAGSYAGHGIGLAFCRKIIEMHGGKITVDTSPDQGTTFYLILPKKLNPVK